MNKFKFNGKDIIHPSPSFLFGMKVADSPKQKGVFYCGEVWLHESGTQCAEYIHWSEIGQLCGGN